MRVALPATYTSSQEVDISRLQPARQPIGWLEVTVNRKPPPDSTIIILTKLLILSQADEGCFHLAVLSSFLSRFSSISDMSMSLSMQYFFTSFHKSGLILMLVVFLTTFVFSSVIYQYYSIIALNTFAGTYSIT